MKSISKILAAVFTIIFFINCTHTKKMVSAESSNMASNTPSTTLTETYWKLTELMGKPVTMDSGQQKEVHMILRKAENKVEGFAGCNGFGGTYTTKNDFNISFSDMIHTMMACPSLDMENEFFTVLKTVDNYYVVGDTLTLSKARMAPMARFVAVYLK
ncbi:MAG: META domain-containing protein [Ginsengibacter sp.]